MKEYDRVVLLVEREEYAKKGVHKGDTGVIWDGDPKDGICYVYFDKPPIQKKDGVWGTDGKEQFLFVPECDLEIFSDK